MLESDRNDLADLLHLIVSMTLQKNSMASYLVVFMLEGDRHHLAALLHLVISM